MAGQQKGKSKAGKKKAKCERYRNGKVRERNKIKRILQSNGLAYAKMWAKERGVLRMIPGMEV